MDGRARQHHVVVGGSAAGIAAALSMRQHGFQGQVTVVEAGGELPYERPPLSKALTEADPAFARPIVPESVYTEQRVDLRLGTRVLALEPASRAVVLDDGRTLHADRVLLATGVIPLTLSVPGAGLTGVVTLRDARDARVLAARLRRGGPLVVVGGGFIGLEVAAVAREAGLDVTVAELGALPLEGPLGAVLAQRVTDLHRRAGVRLRTGVSVAAFTGSGEVSGVRLTTGEVLAAATVVVGVGVRPDTSLAERAGVRCDRGIVVDQYCRTSEPWILAAGDVTNQPHPLLTARGRIEHWDNAQRQGAVAGAVMAGAPRPHTALPYFYSEQFGMTLQMYGRPCPDDEFVLRRDDPAATDGGFLGFWTRRNTLVAAAGMNRPGDLRAARVLIERRVRVDAPSLASSATDLRALARAPMPSCTPERPAASSATTTPATPGREENQ
ncbi:NAD(P)/FAD-dependent oxidoreductase [Streptomyces sp. NPDC059076]|uniref:NAD(P)/FAD-dependent oxidoreductase n=1 Tax=unclassified Streptomyces TaxID=2593676 RepID=UPI0036CB8C47